MVNATLIFFYKICSHNLMSITLVYIIISTNYVCTHLFRAKNTYIRWKFKTKDLIPHKHYNDVIMSAVASQITSVSIVCSTVGSGADQRKHQSSASLAFVQGIHRLPVYSPHKGPVTRKMFPLDDVIMIIWKLPVGSQFCICNRTDFITLNESICV